jgi:tripartite-type tricarboxylate transporter receptor subunit TctC
VGGEMFMIATKVTITRVPYKSTGPALLGLLTNEVHMVFATTGGVMGHVKDGRLKALGVTTAQPSPLIPGVPSLASQGLRDYELDTIGYILAPARTPAPIIKRLNQVVVQSMAQNDVKDRMAAGGSEVVTGTPGELAAKLKSDDTRMRKLLKDIGISADK